MESKNLRKRESYTSGATIYLMKKFSKHFGCGYYTRAALIRVCKLIQLMRYYIVFFLVWSNDHILLIFITNFAKFNIIIMEYYNWVDILFLGQMLILNFYHFWCNECLAFFENAVTSRYYLTVFILVNYFTGS